MAARPGRRRLPYIRKTPTYNCWDGAGYLARVHGWARYLNPDTGNWQYTPDIYTAW